MSFVYTLRLVLRSIVLHSFKAVMQESSEMVPRESFLFPLGIEEVEEDNARRLKVVVNLVVNNFNLAFRVLFEFK